MEFKANMLTKDGKKMMYLIGIEVDKNCEDHNVIWNELKRRMAAVSIPIIPVNWTLYDDNGNAFKYENCLFYAQKFEIGMGFISGVLKIHEIRSNLTFCNFYNGDSYKNDYKKYDAEDSLRITKDLIKKHFPNEVW